MNDLDKKTTATLTWRWVCPLVDCRAGRPELSTKEAAEEELIEHLRSKHVGPNVVHAVVDWTIEVVPA